MSKIGVAIIGAGTIGRAHAEAYLTNADAKLVAVSDVSSEAAVAFANDFNIEVMSLEDVMTSSHIQAVSICTPPNSHTKLTIQACRAGKHVLLEKPITLSTDQAETMIQTAEENNVCTMVAHSHRYWPANVKAKQLLKEGVIGHVLMVKDEILSHMPVKNGQLPWRFQRDLAGGGVVMDNGIHAIDRLRWWLEREVVDVHAALWTVTEGSDVEDNASVTLVFSEQPSEILSDFATKRQNRPLHMKPPVAHVLLSFTAAPSAERCVAEFIGTKGVLTVETWGDITLEQQDGSKQVVPYDDKHSAFHYEVKAFIDAIVNNKPSPVTLQDALASLRVVERAYGRWVAP